MGHSTMHVRGRKTVIDDSECMAFLARVGLVKAGFTLLKDLRTLHLVSCYRRNCETWRKI